MSMRRVWETRPTTVTSSVGNRLTKVPDTSPNANETVVYGYDDENRLTSVLITAGTNAKQIAFAYDPFGRRISKTLIKDEIGSDCTSPNVCPRTTNYVYDGQSIILEYQNGSITAKYTHGPNIDEPLAVEKSGQTYYYHADGLGSISSLSDPSGSIVQTYSYDSFGNMTATGSISQPYTYTAREYDGETGMYFYRARFYDPKAGRFKTKDPIGFAGGDVNLYAYVANNPINWTDPLGLCKCDGGIWDIGAGNSSLSLGAGGYGSWGFVTYTCRSNPKTICKGKKFCVGGGLYAGVGFGWSLTGEVYGQNTSGGLSGWGNTTLTGGLAYGIGRIGISAPWFGKGGGVTGGFGLSGGAALITCYVFDLQCECPCE